MAFGKCRVSPAQMVACAGTGSGLLAPEMPQSGSKLGRRARQPPPILNWLQPEGVGEAGGKAFHKQPAVEMQRKVEQCVQMVTSVWGGTPSRADEAGAQGARGLAPQEGHSCSAGECVGSGDEQDSGSAVLQARPSSATASDAGGEQEALSSSTDSCAVSRGARVSAASEKRSPPGDPAGGSLAPGPLSPGTVYEHQLRLVKQAIREGPARRHGSGLASLDQHIAAKLDNLCRGLPEGGTQQPPLTAGKEQTPAVEAAAGGGSLHAQPPCGDHSQELLERIVAEVRKVVRGAAPLKGSILEQIAEAAFSNKGVAVSPCEVCGVAASADMAHILSVSLGHSLEGSELRIGHAAVALLNARLNDAAGGLTGAALDAGPPPLPLLLLPTALPALDLPSSSDCSWPAPLSRNSSRTSGRATLEHTTPSSAAASARDGLFPAPAPRFNGDAEQHSLLPPLPTFTSAVDREQAGRVPPSEGASGLPLPPPPAWHHDFPSETGATFGAGHPSYGCVSRLDLLDAIKASSAWEPAAPCVAAPPPLLHEDPAYRSLPASLPGFTAYPMPHGGMSVLLTSKARAGEAALAAGQAPGEAAKGCADTEGAPKESGRRAQGTLEDLHAALFGAEGPAPERQLSADELTIQGYLQDDNAELCAGTADALPVGLPAVDDELDLEDPLAAPQNHEWEAFLGGDLTGPGLAAGWSHTPEAGSPLTAPAHAASWDEQAAACGDAHARSLTVGRGSACGAAWLEGEGGEPESAQRGDAGEQGLAAREQAKAQGLAAMAERRQSVLACESSPLSGAPAAYPQEGRPAVPGPSQKVRSLSDLYEVEGHTSSGKGGADEGRKRSKRCVGGATKRQKGGGALHTEGRRGGQSLSHPERGH